MYNIGHAFFKLLIISGASQQRENILEAVGHPHAGGSQTANFGFGIP
jgi:hypothetical protein